MYNNARISQYIIIGASVLVGIVLTETIYRIVRYIVVSRTDANPLLAVINEETEQTAAENEQ